MLPPGSTLPPVGGPGISGRPTYPWGTWGGSCRMQPMHSPPWWTYVVPFLIPWPGNPVYGFL
jgi:hypothetical protein